MTSRPWHEKAVQVALISGLLLITLVFNLSRVVRADYNHDEDQFIASARLLLDEGRLPYRDYAYFHTPYLIYVYAGLFALTGHYNLLAARVFSAVCASASVMMVFAMALQFLKDQPNRYRWLVATAIAFLYLPNPLLASSASFSWNHNLAVLLLLSSTYLLLHGIQKESPRRWLFGSGCLLGLAVGTRLSSLTLLPAILIALFWLPGKFSWRRYFWLAVPYGIGFVIAVLPMAWFLVVAPQQFIFGNLGYARLNTLYRMNIPVAYIGIIPVYGASSLSEKIEFFWNNVAGQPANLLLLAGLVFFGWIALGSHLRRDDHKAFSMIYLIAATPLVAVGSFLPAPLWYQYFYAPVPFALLAIALGWATLAMSSDQMKKWTAILLIELVVISNLYMLQDYRRISFLRYVDLWKPLAVHQVGVAIHDQVGPTGKIFTLAPLYPLEGGLRIYAPMATGVFAYRTGSLLDTADRQAYGIISPENLEAVLLADPPDGILVGFEPELEKEMVAFATSQGYVPRALNQTLTLWVRPGAGVYLTSPATHYVSP